MNEKTLNKDFYTQDAVQVARGLIGKTLCCRQESGNIKECIITCTEAYTTKDPICYGVRYGENKNTCVSFNSGGIAFIYAEMLMVTTGNKNGDPQNVLIRTGLSHNCDGPIKLAQTLGINKQRFNGRELTKENGLWICDTQSETDNEIFAQKRGRFNENNLVEYYMKKHGLDEDEAGRIIKEYIEKEWRFVAK